MRRPWLGLLVGSWLLLAAPLLAHAQAPDDDPSPKQQLQQVEDALKRVQQSWNDAATTDTLKDLTDQANKAARDADGLAKELQPRLDQLKLQRDQLGEVVEGTTESREVTQQRRTLNKQYSDLDAQIKIAGQLATSGRQLAADIDAQRAAQFSDELMHKVASPLSARLWREVADQLAGDVQRVSGLY
ncbi:MAG: hypothetical protein GAK31_02658 [Stenotrophomonas maltophilia]|uniref:DUF3772 domain-containing protein n=1 Tax=Stenotrophomonas maltophilia TaxID=40324 RepID=A0A7V8JLI8_STEMA|nr:MAG: hypothetical protein GAK31_02658 [Stenotrophomonas maltophilia]